MSLRVKVVLLPGLNPFEEVVALQEMGCDCGQGYLFAKPMNAEAMGALLATNPSW